MRGGRTRSRLRAFRLLRSRESGGEFTDGTIGRWLEESLAVFDAFCEGPQVVIGSSMGGWIALLLAREIARRATLPRHAGRDRADRTGTDFTEELMWKSFSPESQTCHRD